MNIRGRSLRAERSGAEPGRAPYGFWNMTTIAVSITAQVSQAETETLAPILRASTRSHSPDTTRLEKALGRPDHELGQPSRRDPEHKTPLNERVLQVIGALAQDHEHESEDEHAVERPPRPVDPGAEVPGDAFVARSGRPAACPPGLSARHQQGGERHEDAPDVRQQHDVECGPRWSGRCWRGGCANRPEHRIMLPRRAGSQKIDGTEPAARAPMSIAEPYRRLRCCR